MTTHGYGPLSRMWMGSVADTLVRRLPMPILLTRPHIGARYTLLPAINPPVLGYAPAAHAVGLDAQMLARWRAEVRMYLDQVADRLRGQGHQVDTQISIGPPAIAILDYARERAVDLIAIATHGRGGVARMLLGSVADKVVRGASTPVLLRRPAAATAEPRAATDRVAAGIEE